jgi:argininosuccinate lyase
MPQKKNSDVAELARGRAATAIGDLVALLAVVKNLPLAYNRDLQEDKRPLIGAPRMLVETLEALSGAISTATFDEARMRAALGDGEALATDAAEYLVERGVPFREAHEAVGRAAAFAGRASRALASLDLAEWRTFHPKFDRGVLRCFDAARSVARRDLPGGPAPRRVAAEIARWEKALARKR